MKYYEEQDKKNIERIRAIQKELPSFCRSFFYDIADYTSTRTRLAYASAVFVFIIGQDYLEQGIIYSGLKE